MKSFSLFLNEASDLRCNNCGDNLGKTTENSKKAYCGTCGSTTSNPSGHDDVPARPSTPKTDGFPKIGMTPRKSENPSGMAFKITKKTDVKHVDHGNGYFSLTTKYTPHDNYSGKQSDFSSNMSVKQAKTTIHHMGVDGISRHIGSIEHVKHHDGEETHTIIHRPMNHAYSGGSVKHVKDAVEKVKDSYNHRLKVDGYLKPENNHGHGVKFVNKE